MSQLAAATPSGERVRSSNCFKVVMPSDELINVLVMIKNRHILHRLI